jgi:hypothetical protein
MMLVEQQKMGKLEHELSFEVGQWMMMVVAIDSRMERDIQSTQILWGRNELKGVIVVVDFRGVAGVDLGGSCGSSMERGGQALSRSRHRRLGNT